MMNGQQVAVRSLLPLLLFSYYLIIVVILSATASSVVAATAAATSSASASVAAASSCCSSSSTSRSTSISISSSSSFYSSPWWSSSSSWNSRSKIIRRTTRKRPTTLTSSASTTTTTTTKTIIPPSSQEEEEKENEGKKKTHNHHPFFSLQPFFKCRGGCNDDGSGSVSTHPASTLIEKKPRRACGFYVWNAPSALLYKWCHHLLKDHLYEGRGGHMFVRYESNSILQLLYPCNRYSPNQCLICGGSFPDHLELWWSKKHLYSPYDQYLETTYKNGLILQKEEDEQGNISNRNKVRSNNQRQRQKRQRSRSSTTRTPIPPVTIIKKPPKFQYHTAYVKDVSDWIKNEKSIKNQMNIIKTKLLQEQKQLEAKEKNQKNRNRNRNRNKGNKSTGTTTKGMRLTRFAQYDVAYILPTTTTSTTSVAATSGGTTNNDNNKDKDGGNRANNNNNNFIKSFIRSITISTLDDLIMLQEKENKKLSSS